jgi:hypothetical protein
MKIAKKTDLKDLFKQNVSDPRKGQITYPAHALLMHGVLSQILRCSSVNGFYNHIDLSHIFEENISKLIGTNSIPDPKTIEDFYIQLEYSDLEYIMPTIFYRLLRKKIFKLNPELNSGESNYKIMVDAQVVHIYKQTSQHPCDACPYCLKRTRGNSTWYVHIDIVLSVVGENGFQLPLFFHRVRKLASLPDNCSEDEFKQQCELSAFPILIEKFRRFFPRLKVTILLDSLYANGPVITILEKYEISYIIVRKDGSIKSLTEDVEGLKKLTSPIMNKVIDGRWNKEQTCLVFQNMSHQGHVFNIIDLSEKCHKLASSRFAKITEKQIHWQWIISQQVDNKNIFKIAACGRLRWYQEDFFNTIQHRGFKILHDFSRHPNSQIVRVLLMLIAFVISILMQFSRLGHLSRKGTAIINWISHLLGLLENISIDMNEPLPGQLRFAFDSS